ncbi:MAG: MFS transporter [Clostridiaceae bacterium]
MRFFRNRVSGAMFLIFEGIVYTMVFNLYNPFIQMFGKRLGAGDVHIALLNAAPPLVAVFVLIPFGILIERINRKKQTVLLLLLINSLFYAAIAFIPSIPHQAKVLAYVALIGLMNCPGSLYLTTWQSYFADNFKGSYANRVYSVRSKYGTFFGLLTVLVTGILLTAIPHSDEERLFMYQIFYGVCFVLTLLQVFLFSKVYDHDEYHLHAGYTDNIPATAKTEDTAKTSHSFGKAELAEMLVNKPFLIFCLCGFAFHLAWQMGWPLFFIYNANYAGLNEFQISLINVASSLAQFLSYTLWNRLIDKKGSSLMIIPGALGLALTPFGFMTLVSFPLILFINTFSGFFMACFNLTLFSNLLETLPARSKTVYISVFNTLTNITGFVAPMIGVWIYNRTNIYMALTIVGIVRITATMLYVVRWWTGRTDRKGKTGNTEITG